ncbi:MAG: response regulator [Minwuia sp.]|nr:response regulator [Minwuia sp.]
MKLAEQHINLAQVNFLVADENEGGRRVMQSILQGFGAVFIHHTGSLQATRDRLMFGGIDVLICDFFLGNGRGPDFVKELRRTSNHPARYIPVLITCGHLTARDVGRCRDSGANLVLTKPVSVQALYERLAAIAHRPRPFVDHEVYAGPCRRFRAAGAPNQIERRMKNKTEAGMETRGRAVRVPNPMITSTGIQ